MIGSARGEATTHLILDLEVDLFILFVALLLFSGHGDCGE
jgi:hypothetical protein